MKIGIHDADKTKFPNLALMKLSAAYKQAGHEVEFFAPGKQYDKVVSSKVFTFTEKDPELPATTILGGVGYDVAKKLPESVEHLMPDYTLYRCDKSYGFLTRGCLRSCPWCFVPRKEGGIRPHADIEEFLAHDSVVLMDNNVLACGHGIAQIEKLGRLGVKVDFNQGMDARLIDDSIAKRLKKVKWLYPVRLACDSASQMPSIQKAVTLLRWHGVTPSKYFVYVLVKDVDDALERVKFLRGMWVDPFCQPYIDFDGTPPTLLQRQLARWVNTKQAFTSMSFEEYVAWRGERV